MKERATSAGNRGRGFARGVEAAEERAEGWVSVDEGGEESGAGVEVRAEGED